MFNRILGDRAGYLLGFVVAFGLVGLALYIQQQNNLDPCPLCISQRIAYMVLGAIFLVAALHNPGKWGRRIYGFLQFAAAATGAGIALRHMWIQANPDKVMSECGVGMDYMFENFPMQRALQWVFNGTGECSKIDWTWFGLTIPQLSLIAFAGFAIFAIALACMKK
ncbi:MAG: disulfide bond formation protein B [Methylobacillus sp.]|jgi:disulfide bond formation protein DsbB|nr:disulfide bond formation protein B [Methylobacillus sp.]